MKQRGKEIGLSLYNLKHKYLTTTNWYLVRVVTLQQQFSAVDLSQIMFIRGHIN